MRKKFYITTPIYYVNAPPHIGHAFTTIVADVLARYHRALGEKVFFLTGTDEHGFKIAKVAKSLGKTPLQFCNQIAKEFKKTWQKLDISYDNFIRTTSPKHTKAVQRAFSFLKEKNFIYKGFYEGLYCSGCEQFKTKKDLVDGKCPDHAREPELVREENYIFSLSKFTKILTKKIESKKLEILPQKRKNEILKFLKEGLNDVSFSRPKEKVEWGITVPFDKNQTIYVWVDAFLNYLTGIGWDGDPKNVPEFWPPDLQLMGKDILRVHATIWPAILLALGLPLPKLLFAHGYFTVNGQKMSKSLGNIIHPLELVDKFGSDATRYLLLSICSLEEGGDVSWEKFLKKYNGDLAYGLGNLIMRVAVLGEKIQRENPFRKIKLRDKKIILAIKEAKEKYKNFIEKFKLDQALISVWQLIGFCDKFIENKKPWQKSKEQPLIIGDLLIAIGEIAQMLQPFLPQTSKRIFKEFWVKNNKNVWDFKITLKRPLFPAIKA